MDAVDLAREISDVHPCLNARSVFLIGCAITTPRDWEDRLDTFGGMEQAIQDAIVAVAKHGEQIKSMRVDLLQISGIEHIDEFTPEALDCLRRLAKFEDIALGTFKGRPGD